MHTYTAISHPEKRISYTKRQLLVEYSHVHYIMLKAPFINTCTTVTAGTSLPEITIESWSAYTLITFHTLSQQSYTIPAYAIHTGMNRDCIVTAVEYK